MKMRTTRSDKGFTFIELMIVMVLIVVVLSVSMVFFGNVLPSAKLNATGRELSAMMRYARILAMNNGEPQTVTIDLDSGRYGIDGVQTRMIPEGIGVKVVDPIAGEVNRGSYPVLFHESGGAEGGRITLSTSRRVLTIDLDPVLGAVIVKQ